MVHSAPLEFTIIQIFKNDILWFGYSKITELELPSNTEMKKKLKETTQDWKKTLLISRKCMLSSMCHITLTIRSLKEKKNHQSRRKWKNQEMHPTPLPQKRSQMLKLTYKKCFKQTYQTRQKWKISCRSV